MAKKLAMLFGVIFVIVGLLGFVSNPIVGSGNAMFLTNTMHNIVHLLVGVIMIIMSSQGEASASMSLTIFGVIYLVLAVLGFLMKSPLLGFVDYNSADNWLHLVLGVVLLAAGMMKKSQPAPMTPPM